MGDKTQPSESYEVFISYSSKDVEIAKKLNAKLVDAGFVVWFDQARLDPGCNWHKEIEAGCKASRVLLPVLTENWKESTWTRYETYGAEAILPLHVSGEIENVLTPPLSRVQCFSIDPQSANDEEWDAFFVTFRALLAKPRVEKGERTAHLRYRPNPNFVGREQDLLNIHEALYRTPTAALTQGQSIAINAMGGVGKTTLAREYAEHYWRLYKQILWVDARIGFVSEFARLAEILNPQLKDASDANEKAAYTLQALNSQTERLLILDNVEDEESAQDWIPKAGGCRTIITSRFSSWSSAVQTLHVYVLAAEPARELLLKKAGKKVADENVETVDKLAKALGYLPLALEQAAAFIHEEGEDFSFADYSRLYQQSTKELLVEGVLGSTEYPDSVMTTWRATMERLANSPIARSLLRLASFYGSEPIPQALFTESVGLLQQQSALLTVDDSPVTTSSTSSNEMIIRRALKELARYSMIDRHGHSFQIHALVQTVQRLEVPEAEQKLWLETALNIVNVYAPPESDDVRTWPLWEPVGPHIAAVIQHADEMQITNLTSRLLNDYGLFLNAKSQFTKAEPLIKRALAIDETIFGPEHPDVARDLKNLSTLLRSTNRLKEAEPLMRRALAINESALGLEHPSVAIDLNNLGLLLQDTNRLEEAELLFKRALAIDEIALGPNHPGVARDLDNLVGILQETNRLVEAESLLRRALEIDEAAFGPEHPDVARDLNNLALLLKYTNRLDDAERLYRQALAINEAIFESEHPKVAINLNNLAQLLHDTNRQEEAEPLYRRALEIDEQSFGSEHPKVARDLNNLADLLKDVNRLTEAEPLMRRVLEIDERSHGSEHPIISARLGNLGELLRMMNRLHEAEPLLRRALEIDTSVLEKDHPDIARDGYKLAMWEYRKGNVDEAQRLLENSLALFRKNFSDDRHPRIQETFKRMREIGMDPPD